MARWTDLAEWVGPTVNEGDGDGTPLESEDHLTEVRGLVLHTAEGYYKGTISWQRGDANNVSSHFVVAGARDLQYGVPDGKLAQMVDTADRAWTQQAGNSRWLSLECSGFGSRGDKLSPGQLEAAAQLLARAHIVYGVPLQIASNPTERGLGHHSMDREGIDPEWGHDDCPGPAIIAQKPLIVARAIQIVNGDNMSLTAAEHANLVATDERVRVALIEGKDSYADDGLGTTKPWIVTAVKGLLADVAELKGRPLVQAGPVDPAALKAVLLDPEVLAAIGKAVLDEQHHRDES